MLCGEFEADEVVVAVEAGDEVEAVAVDEIVTTTATITTTNVTATTRINGKRDPLRQQHKQSYVSVTYKPYLME